jgi:uncharacterized NAD-dependent epimerase/dehydratase family protein
LARRTNPKVRCGGLSINTVALQESEARAALADYHARYGLPAADPIRGGPELERLVTACLRPAGI